MSGYGETILIPGEDCDYDPTRHVVRIVCENCGHVNEVALELENGEPCSMGFVCDNSGTLNPACG